MKTQSIIKSDLFAAGFSAMLLIGNASAAPVVINGQLGDGSNSLAGIGSGSTIAPLSYSGTTWNELGLGTGATALLNSDGSSSGVTYTGYNFAATDNGGTLTLLKSGSYNSGGTATLTFSGLTSGDTYDIVVAADVSNLDSVVSIAGYGSQSTTNADTFSSSFIPDGNYVEFDNVATTGSIVVDVTGGPGNGGSYFSVNGFQIENVTPPAVPEPTSLALLGLGALALLVVSRRRTA